MRPLWFMGGVNVTSDDRVSRWWGIDNWRQTPEVSQLHPSPKNMGGRVSIGGGRRPETITCIQHAPFVASMKVPWEQKRWQKQSHKKSQKSIVWLQTIKTHSNHTSSQCGCHFFWWVSWGFTLLTCELPRCSNHRQPYGVFQGGKGLKLGVKMKWNGTKQQKKSHQRRSHTKKIVFLCWLRWRWKGWERSLIQLLL